MTVGAVSSKNTEMRCLPLIAPESPLCVLTYEWEMQKNERGPRGKYARLICRGCRARKIKCVLPSPAEIGPLGIPQSHSMCCERCRTLDLECVIERSFLGRPAANRAKRVISQFPKSDSSPSTEPSLEDGEHSLKLPDSIRQYLFSGAINDSLMLQRNSRSGSETAEGEIFQTISDPASFIASILAKDDSFGADIHLISNWKTPLPDIISQELAMTLDNLLVWHRLFVLAIPSLVNLRERLISVESSSSNVATQLLFALLCLTACGSSVGVLQQHPSLKQSLEQAVSTYGQDFIFSPPTHLDSIAVCRFLTNFKPTALATSQRVAHQAVKGELYINLAYRIAERLNLLPNPEGPHIGLHLLCDGLFLGGYLSIPFRSLQNALIRMAPHIHTYQVLMQTQLCSPIMIFHMKWITATYIKVEVLANSKQNWMNPSQLFITIEDAERKCLEEINSAYELLTDVSDPEDRAELLAICSLLEIRFHSAIAQFWGLGLLYATVLRSRSESGQVKTSNDIGADEASQLSDKLVHTILTTPDDQKSTHFFHFLQHFGERYPDKMQGILAKFIECTSLKLGGNTFQPPIGQVVLEIVNHCKNIVENNLIQFKTFGQLHPNFDKQLDLFTQCAQKFGGLLVQPGSSPKNALGSGCVYSASSKMIYGLSDLMNNLKSQASLVKDLDETLGVEPSLIIPHNTPTLDFNASVMQFNSFETWNLWPDFDPLGNCNSTQYSSEWILQSNNGIELDESTLSFP